MLVRQRCCLIICSYIGWIDKYWDGGSNPSQGFAAFSKGQSAFRPIFFGDLALPHEESNIWNSFQFISINIQALRGALPLIFKTWARTKIAEALSLVRTEYSTISHWPQFCCSQWNLFTKIGANESWLNILCRPMRVLPALWCRVKAQILKITNAKAPLSAWILIEMN